MNTRKHIAILVPYMHKEDAVGNDVFFMKKIFHEAGYESEIFAEKCDKGLIVKPVNKLRDFVRNSSDILIYHYSIAWSPIFDILNSLNCIKIIKYHNVTPAKFFEPYHEGIAEACRAGREQIAELTKIKSLLFLSDSAYNQTDLNIVPKERSDILSPFTPVEKLLALEPSIKVIEKYACHKKEKIYNILMVGRLAPNKGYELLIESFAKLSKKADFPCRLLIVGKKSPELKKYYKVLDASIKKNGVSKSVIITGEASPQALKAYYLCADLFCSFSDHEGFCVPLVEAMALKIPIVAKSAGAIPETAKDASLLINGSNPEDYANAMHSLILNESRRYDLQEQGFQRYQKYFTFEKQKVMLLSYIENLTRLEHG